MFCVWCYTTKKLTKEHMVPVGLGGLTLNTNLARACQKCNGERGQVTNAVLQGRKHPLYVKWVERERAIMGYSPHEEHTEVASRQAS